jgi:hypothetical protein
VQQRRPDAAVAELGQQRDVDDADLVVPAVEVETTGRLPADENDVERRARIVLLMLHVLDIELHGDECGLLFVVPGYRGELRLADSADPLGYLSQFSTLKAGTRLNSATLSVTHTASMARACAAISMSCAPIGVPFRSSVTRIEA